MKLITGEFEEKLRLQIAPSIRAGFPSPAEDYLTDSLDFNRDLIKHPEATFYGKVKGDSMIGLGINEGDIAVIDRSIEAEHGDIVVAYIEGDFNVKLLDLTHKEDGYMYSILIRTGKSSDKYSYYLNSDGSVYVADNVETERMKNKTNRNL